MTSTWFLTRPAAGRGPVVAWRQPARPAAGRSQPTRAADAARPAPLPAPPAPLPAPPALLPAPLPAPAPAIDLDAWDAWADRSPRIHRPAVTEEIPA